jgi:hypothetical protein
LSNTEIIQADASECLLFPGADIGIEEIGEI